MILKDKRFRALVLRIALFLMITVPLFALFFLPRETAVMVQADTQELGIVLAASRENQIALPAGWNESAGMTPLEAGDMLVPAGGARLTLRLRRSGFLALMLEPGPRSSPGDPLGTLDGAAIAEPLVLIFNPDGIAAFDPIEMFGEVTLGTVVTDTSVSYLSSGDYVFWETGLLSEASDPVRTGSFAIGSLVEIQGRNGDPFEARLFVEPAGRRGEDDVGMFAMVDTGYGAPRLKVHRSRLDKALDIAPRWTDRALSSPLLLGFSSTLAAILLVLQLVGFLRPDAENTL
ncbi:hypothetical protein [Tropicibacter sp. S64]|uniref:hypothetical protein n=1 Tax=Tropicibacter sp. S64 TaxID=3415122 RepID=UPI003C7E097D